MAKQFKKKKGSQKKKQLQSNFPAKKEKIGRASCRERV